MDIETIKKKKDELQKEIAEKLCEFYSETGVEVRYIDIDVREIDTGISQIILQKRIIIKLKNPFD